MKVKVKTDTATGAALEALITRFAERYNAGTDTLIFCHLENMKQAAHYIRKRVYLSATDKINFTFEHNTIYTLYFIFHETEQGQHVYSNAHILVKIFLTDLFDRFRKKSELQMNVQKALKHPYAA